MQKYIKKGLALLFLLTFILTATGCEAAKEATRDVAGDLAGAVAEQVINSGLDALQEHLDNSSPSKGDPSTAGDGNTSTTVTLSAGEFNYEDIPEFDGSTPYVVINDNQPYFTDEEKTCLEEFETYSELDDLGRCGVCVANVCQNLMPTEERGEIGSVKPSGWKQAKYSCIESGYLYNRCHIIGYQLSGENANVSNLLSGSRYLNVDGMLVFENMVADYVHETNNHVMYRVTPVFIENELVCRGVLMEGWSVEDDGEGICYNVFCYNNQPGITIDYATGDSWEN